MTKNLNTKHHRQTDDLIKRFDTVNILPILPIQGDRGARSALLPLSVIHLNYF